MYRERTVAAVVPAYNEEGFVGGVIDGLPSFVDRAYVVDDGSTDDTWSEIREHAAARNDGHDGHFDRLVVPIRHEENRGVGGAIKTGYLKARDEEIDVTVVLGGDDQMDPRELTRYIDPIVDGVADYTKGNRFAHPAGRAAMPRFRLLGNVILSYLTKIASGYWGVMDSQNGYTAISLAALRRTDVEGMYEYYGYCNDLLVRLNVAGVRVADVPRSAEYAYSDGWKSHIDYKEYIPRVSAMLFRGFQWRLREKYFLESYNPLAPLYLLGMGVLAGGVAGLVATLARRKSQAGTWFLSLVVGSLVFLYATILDRADNADLERQVQPDREDDPAGEAEPGVDGPGTPDVSGSGGGHGKSRRATPQEPRLVGGGTGADEDTDGSRNGDGDGTEDRGGDGTRPGRNASDSNADGTDGATLDDTADSDGDSTTNGGTYE
ncbi:MAG: glycosyltransferase [archaeon]